MGCQVVSALLASCGVEQSELHILAWPSVQKHQWSLTATENPRRRKLVHTEEEVASPGDTCPSGQFPYTWSPHLYLGNVFGKANRIGFCT